MTRKQEWSKAITEGRIVKVTEPRDPMMPHTEVQRFTMCGTAHDAAMLVFAERDNGNDAKIVTECCIVK